MDLEKALKAEDLVCKRKKLQEVYNKLRNRSDSCFCYTEIEGFVVDGEELYNIVCRVVKENIKEVERKIEEL